VRGVIWDSLFSNSLLVLRGGRGGCGGELGYTHSQYKDRGFLWDADLWIFLFVGGVRGVSLKGGASRSGL